MSTSSVREMLISVEDVLCMTVIYHFYIGLLQQGLSRLPYNTASVMGLACWCCAWDVVVLCCAPSPDTSFSFGCLMVSITIHLTQV